MSSWAASLEPVDLPPGISPLQKSLNSRAFMLRLYYTQPPLGMMRRAYRPRLCKSTSYMMQLPSTSVRPLCGRWNMKEEAFITPHHARKKLFDEILEQLSICDLFSNPALGEPTIFPVYAHKNDTFGIAHDAYVHDLISWLQKIKARILSDKSPLHPLTSDYDDTSAQRNIIANQIRLLPPIRGDLKPSEAITCIDKVLVCGSEVLESYCGTPYALKYIDQVVKICNDQKSPSSKTLKSQIENLVDREQEKASFHHVLTEIAFLRVRRSRRPDRHGMIPVALNGAHHLPYLSVFLESDITFKLKSASAAAKHALFFQLLEQLFVHRKELAIDFRNCYKKVVEDLKLDLEENNDISRADFHNCLNSNMTKMYHKHWDTFSTAMRNGKFNKYQGILEKDVLEILDQKKAKERREILHWVSPMTAPPMPGKYQDGRAKRLDGTCDWVIKDEQFIQWDESETSTIISLRGSMGVGKTFATSRVIEWVQRSLNGSQKKASAFFYCIEEDEMRSTAAAIIRNIARQLATGPREGLPIEEAIVNMWKIHGHNDKLYDTTTLDEWEDCLYTIISNYDGVTIVLDALDECKTDQRRDLTKLFSSLAARCSNLKIFVSTRPEPDLSRWLDSQRSISMHNERTSDDIAAFVQDKIAQHSEWPYIDDELKSLMLQTVVEKSQGLFLCAYLQTQNLQECLVEEDIREELRSLPNELTKLYEKLYLRATIKTAEKKLVDKALKWVLCSFKPLTSDDLLFAISQESQTDDLLPIRPDMSERLLLKLCHNFLTLHSSNSEYGPPVWRFAHQAAAEFFETSASWSEQRANMHYEAARVCMMITLNTFRGSVVEDSTTRDNWIGFIPVSHIVLPRREADKPLVLYAIHAWPTHMRIYEHQEPYSNRCLSQMLLRFVDDPQEGCVIYERWSRWVNQMPPDQTWRLSQQRKVPWSWQSNMSPICLVSCLLGFPQSLHELWKSASLGRVAHHTEIGWSPWLGGFNSSHRLFEQLLRWSAVALACVHDELKVLQCLLSSNPQPPLHTFSPEEVPPIVAAAIGDSVQVMRELLRPQHGISISSSFTMMQGHVLRFALRADSLQVLPMLLDRVLLEPSSLEGALSSVSRRDFKSTKALALLLEKGVDVNTPLQDGTLLAVAASLGDERLVDELLRNGADVNMQFDSLQPPFWRWDAENEEWTCATALEACLFNWGSGHRSSLLSLLIKHGARVSVKALAFAFDAIENPSQHGFGIQSQQPLRDALHILTSNIASPNETLWTNRYGRPTCALNEALRISPELYVEALLDRGADPNLALEGRPGAMMSTVFAMGMANRLYPTCKMIELLEKAGADFSHLRDHDLNMALAGAIWTGLPTLVPFFLERGADPNKDFVGPFGTALTTAAASGYPEAPDIIRMLLNNMKGIVNVRIYHSWHHHSYSFNGKLALDFPLWLILDKEMHSRIVGFSHAECRRNWARSALALVSNGAVWDIDFERWRECLKAVEPEFASQEEDTLNKIKEGLERNWNGLSDSQKATDVWSIKDPLSLDFDPTGPADWRSLPAPIDGPRLVLASMKEILLRR